MNGRRNCEYTEHSVEVEKGEKLPYTGSEIAKNIVS